MPRTLKRRSDAISRDDSAPAQDSSPEPEPSTNNRRRRPSTSSSEASAVSANGEVSELEDGTQGQTQQSTLVKKLVRLALATEYSRQPLRRADISTKVFKDSGSSGRGFKGVFAEAQKILANVFGMKLVELPGREKTGIKERRLAATQATQRKEGKGKQKEKESQGGEVGATGGGKSWILVSTLPEAYKRNPDIIVPSKAPTVDTEAGYTALYTFVVAIVWLNGNELSEGKMERYMEKVNVGGSTDWGSWDKVLSRMVREGYVDRRKEQEEGWVYSVGPRGKVEVGTRGVEGLVKAVYGVGGGGDEEPAEEEAEGAAEGANPTRPNGEMDEDELKKRLTRSLGVSVGGQRQTQEVQMVDGGDDEANGNQPEPQQRRRSGRRRGGGNDDDDE